VLRKYLIDDKWCNFEGSSALNLNSCCFLCESHPIVFRLPRNLAFGDKHLLATFYQLDCTQTRMSVNVRSQRSLGLSDIICR
jgi:hypothetical protein